MVEERSSRAPWSSNLKGLPEPEIRHMLAHFIGGLNREIQTILEYKDILISLVYSILIVKLNVKCRIDRHWRKLTFLQVDLHHRHRVHPLLPHIPLHWHLRQLPPPIMVQESSHNHHYLLRAHLLGLHRALLLPWRQQGTQVIYLSSL